LILRAAALRECIRHKVKKNVRREIKAHDTNYDIVRVFIGAAR
jgi:hypothetical protein